ncbi:MAG TPA: hypothetical protein DCY79_25625 [Planctomycetaceae bacterium]|nr:hypothetical protein [Planctomycetaceae bacterium]
MSEPSIAVIASTMRSGSTLLKALLAEAPDISNLPETNFQKYHGHPQALEELGKLDEHPILLLKRPCWFQEVRRYPRLPTVDNVKTILLVRDVYETVVSLRKMAFRQFAGTLGPWANRFLIQGYWAGVMRRLNEVHEADGASTCVVRYEDLVRDPIATTASLFTFLGSERTTGTDTYSQPEDYQWKWGQDDGGPKIKTLQVQSPKPHGYPDRALLRAIHRSSLALQMRQQFGYSDLPAP